MIGARSLQDAKHLTISESYKFPVTFCDRLLSLYEDLLWAGPYLVFKRRYNEKIRRTNPP